MEWESFASKEHSLGSSLALTRTETGVAGAGEGEGKGWGHGGCRGPCLSPPIAKRAPVIGSLSLLSLESKWEKEREKFPFLPSWRGWMGPPICIYSTTRGFVQLFALDITLTVLFDPHDHLEGGKASRCQASPAQQRKSRQEEGLRLRDTV